ncbi:MAG: antibiotic biosynthesis monooxygenase [Chloroflexi bacterium]|nr:antibiotic biosynthesis monooxygenase [Chloroflexota bacterium]
MNDANDATFYVRLSLMNPKRGQDERVSQIMDDLLEFFITQPGYVRGYRLLSGDQQQRVGRITVWESESAADRAANTQHSLSARSELLPIIEEDSHVERSYTAFDPQLAAAAAEG